MTVTVYHWKYAANLSEPSVGHIAINVAPQGKKAVYYSWYPATEKDPKAVVSTPGRSHTRTEDRKNGTPTDVVTIEGLNEEEMVSFLKEPRVYSLFGTSCAQVVADALRAGIGGKYKAGIMNANPIWTPLTAKDFALRIKTMLNNGRLEL